MSITRAAPRRSVRVGAAARLGRLARPKTSRRIGVRGSGGVIGGRVMLALAPGTARELSARPRRAARQRHQRQDHHVVVPHRLPAGPLGRGQQRGRGEHTQPGSCDRSRQALRPWSCSRRTRAGCRGPWPRPVPGTAVLLNLSRDQLHRHHEVAALASPLAPRARRPRARGRRTATTPTWCSPPWPRARQTWVSVGIRWTQDSLVCPRCGGECRHTAGLGLRLRPASSPSGLVARVGTTWSATRCGSRCDLGLPGQANLANAAMAVATAAALGVDRAEPRPRLRDIASVAGRYAVVDHDGRRTRLILAKNPAGWARGLRRGRHGTRRSCWPSTPTASTDATRPGSTTSRSPGCAGDRWSSPVAGPPTWWSGWRWTG